MKNSIQITQFTEVEMETIFGGTVISNSDSFITPFVATIGRALSELSRIAMDYQASLPPNLKK